MKSIEDLDVFHVAHELTLIIYKISETFPKSEMFGLSSQLRRAAFSINSNLSEGGSRVTTGELRQFVSIARGSVGELRYQLKLAKDLGYIDIKNYNLLIEKSERIHKMLTGLIKNITKKNSCHMSPVTCHES